jgi:hypothetical protein
MKFLGVFLKSEHIKISITAAKQNGGPIPT